MNRGLPQGDEAGRRGPGRRKGSGARAGADASWGQRAIQALAEPSRWRIILALQSKDSSLSALALDLDLSLACVSRHVAILRESDLLTIRREGREIHCDLPAPGTPGARLLQLVLAAADANRYQSKSRLQEGLSSGIPEFDSPPPARSARNNSFDIEDYLL